MTGYLLVRLPIVAFDPQPGPDDDPGLVNRHQQRLCLRPGQAHRPILEARDNRIQYRLIDPAAGAQLRLHKPLVLGLGLLVIRIGGHGHPCGRRILLPVPYRGKHFSHQGQHQPVVTKGLDDHLVVRRAESGHPARSIVAQRE